MILLAIVFNTVIQINLGSFCVFQVTVIEMCCSCLSAEDIKPVCI